MSEAILLNRTDGSAWSLTFSPVDPVAGHSIKATIRTEVVEEMSFVETYTRAQIEALKTPDSN